MGRQRKTFNHLHSLPLREIQGDAAVRDPPGAEERVNDLARSLAARGLQQPILVTDGSRRGLYRVIVGKKRLQAARQLGWPAVDGIVLGRDFAREIAVIERLQQDQFDPFELADTLARLKSACDWTQAHLGQAIGKTRDFVANILAINDILPDVRRYVQDHAGKHPLTARHLRYVAREAPESQLAVAKKIIGSRLSTKALEQDKRGHTLRSPDREIIRVRELRRAGSPGFPRSAKEWRRYARQLATDLRRIDRRELAEQRRAQELLQIARQRQSLVRREAAAKRRLLHHALRSARRHLARLGEGGL
jgi:ParB/RepB/Spo0J family partition protein